MMNKAFNAIKSTLSAGWNSAPMKGLMSGAKTQMKQFGGLAGVRNSADFARLASRGVRRGAAMNKWQQAGSIGAAGATIGAAADFLNPWGLGWGD